MSKEINIAGRISHFFAIHRPLSILVLFVALVFGLGSFFLTPKQYNPEITRPAFAVTVNYEGATTDGAVNRVVYELVEKIDTVPGVDDIYTEVRDGAVITTTVIFQVGYDAVRAKVDLLSQLEQHSYLARGNIKTPAVIEVNPETIPILQIVFGSERLSVPELRKRVVELSQRLSVIEEVSELAVFGGYTESLLIEVDPQLLAAHELTLETVTGVLAKSQFRFVTAPARTEPYLIETVFDSTVATAAAIGELPLSETVQLRDVARVYEGAGNNRSYVFHQNAEQQGEVVMLSVAKVEGASAPEVTDRFLEKLETVLSEAEFSTLTYQVVGNDGATAKTEINGLTSNLITSIAIVAVVLLLFLSVRAAFVVLVAIPITLLIVFGLGFLFDQTINRITLFALILSLGLLVDSAIVAVENIYSHLKQWQEEPSGKTRERVIAQAIDEVGMGLLLSTLTSVIVFLPMNYITGMMGPYMGPIAFFVPAALIVSFVVAITVTPFVANSVLHVETTQNKVAAVFARGVAYVTARYVAFLRKVVYSATLQKRILWGAVAAFIVSLILPLTGLVHFQMLPRADRDQLYVYLDLPVGTDKEATKRVAASVSELLLRNPEVTSVQRYVATPPIVDFNGMFKGAQMRNKPEQATLRVNLTSAGDRALSSTEITSALRTLLNTELPVVAAATRFIEEPPGPPVRATLVAKITATEAETQQAAVAAIKKIIASVAGVVDTYQSDEANIGRVHYRFDHVAAAKLGVSPAAVQQVSAMLDGRYEITEFLARDAVEYTPMLLTFPSEQLQSPNFINTVTVMNNVGEAIPLQSVITLTHEARPSTVYFEDAQSLSYVTAEVENRSIVYVTIEIIKRLLRGELSGYLVTDWNLWGLQLTTEDGKTVALVWGGEWEMTLENFRDLGIAMGVALLMVYALLVAQYNTFRTPAYILVTVPLGLVGILWGFFLLDSGFNIYLTATALIGFIALIGIVVNNAIIYLEYVEQAKVAGASYHEALIAAGEARLRPIFLTSLTTVLGSLTIAGDPVWSGLAWAIVFGLSLSTILTLLIYPILLARFTSE